MTSPKLLTDAEMQHFIAHGYLCLRTELPDRFHRSVWEQCDRLIGTAAKLNPGNNLLPAMPELPPSRIRLLCAGSTARELTAPALGLPLTPVQCAPLSLL